MALAWEMLELARLIYNNNGGPQAHASKLADCHLYIGDILAEQVGLQLAAWGEVYSVGRLNQQLHVKDLQGCTACLVMLDSK